MRGNLLNTLSYRLRDELRHWRKTNSTLQENAWPWYHRALISAGSRPLRYPLLLFIAVIVLSAIIWVFDALPNPFLPAFVPPAMDSNGRFYTLWMMQATIAAMIYPIAIGFVALLLQRRHSAKASLHIYLHDSAAILTGLNALFLVATMAIQFLLLPIAGNTALTHWLVLDTIWFLVNILGTIWFLARTFDYLRPKLRANITRAYAINHVWPAEMRSNLQYRLFLMAIHYGWLPGPDYSYCQNESNTEILLGPLGAGEGSIQVTGKYKVAHIISDVRFRCLHLAIRSWQRREEKVAASANDQSERLLILPLVPGDLFKEQVGLCSTKGGNGLRWWERWLIRRSFMLVPNTRKAIALSISDILNGLITEVQVAMESREEVAFRDALNELADLHAALLLAGDFISDTGQRDNYNCLVDRSGTFEPKIHSLWTREYRRLCEGAVNQLLVSNNYFCSLAYMTGQLIAPLEEVRPVSILSDLLRLPRSLHYHLNLWWSKTVKEQELLDHGPCNPGTLNMPAFTAYESAIKEFIGAWEFLTHYNFPPTRDKVLDWIGYGEITELYSEHLGDTLIMLFHSLWLGNKEGAEWLCDSLIKWWHSISYRFDNVHCIRDKRKLTLTLSLLRKPWDEARDVIDILPAGSGETGAPKALWKECVHNYWIDLCCISIYSMLQFGKSCNCEESLPALLAVALWKGEALRAGNDSQIGARLEWPVQQLEDLLIALIRQYYFDGEYRERLDKVAESIFSQGKPSRVDGRFYVWSGPEDLNRLRDGQLLFLCLLAREVASPPMPLMQTIQKWGADNDNELRAFIGQLEEWKTRLAEAEFLAYGGIYSCIQNQFEFAAIDEMQDAIDALSAYIDQITEGIDNFRTDPLKSAPFSEDKRNQVAKWCSQSGFTKESANIPVSLFREVKHSVEEYTEYNLVIRGMHKGEFVEPLMEQPAVNDDTWFDQAVISSHVAELVMAKVLGTIGCETIDVDGPLAYWKQIKSAAEAIRNNGKAPILLVAGLFDPSWLFDWTHGTYDEQAEKPEDLQWTHDEQFKIEGYEGSLNEIPVFVAPIAAGSSYLIPQDVLNILTFTKFENDVYIKVSFEPVEGKDALTDVKLSWRFQADLNAGRCWQLRYAKPQEPMETV